MNLYYGFYHVDTDVSDFIASVYQAELGPHLAIKSEMGCYVRNMSELQSPNHTIGFTGPTHRLVTHQATSWTQQLYKDKHTRAATQYYNHPDPYTPLRATTVADLMKICPFYAPRSHTSTLFLHGDSIHLHVHCSNIHIQHTRTRSNTDISTALRHLGAFLSHAPYPHNLGDDPFRTILGALLRQYDDNTRCVSVHSVPILGETI